MQNETILNYITVTTEDGLEKHIRVFGSVYDPHFCGKDICEIMDLEAPTKRLQNMVSHNNKKELKNLLEEEINGYIPPFEVGTRNVPTLLGSVDLKNLKHNDGRLVVLSEPGVEELLNGTKGHKNKKIIRDAINMALYTIKFKNNNGMMGFTQFISRFKLAIDIRSKWYRDLWYPMIKSQHSPGAVLTMVKSRPIIITQNLLEWMGYKGRYLADKQLNFIRFVNGLNIPYEEINYQNPLALEYPGLQEEIVLVPKNNLGRKTWISMDQRAFRKLVMRLNTQNADVVREYYLNLEDASVAYLEYATKFTVDKVNKEKEVVVRELTTKDQELAIKEQEQMELKETLAIKDRELATKEQELDQEKETRLKSEREAKERLERALKFNQATRPIEPIEYIYIATTDCYLTENKFKVGGCASFDLVKSRLSQYNSGKSDSDTHYFIYLKKVVSYKSVEQILLSCLGGFRENAYKELYIINYDWLVRCLEAVIEHDIEFLTFVNLNREQMVKDTLNKEPAKVIPIRLEKIRVVYQRVGEKEVELTTIIDQDTIDAVREALTSFNPDNNTIKRMVFESHLRENHPKVKIDQRKRVIWDIVKQVGSSINPKWRFKY